MKISGLNKAEQHFTEQLGASLIERPGPFCITALRSSPAYLREKHVRFRGSR